MRITKENKSLYVGQISADITLISFLALITVFFIGSLLPQFNSYDLSIKIPISFFIISTLGLLFAGLILSNANQKITQDDFSEAERYLKYGYSFSEYIGVYLFVISIPLIVNIISTDFYLRTVAFLAVILGMAFYQFMGFSLIKDHFSRSNKLFSIITILLGVILFFSQIYNFYFIAISIIFILYILFITALAPMKEFR